MSRSGAGRKGRTGYRALPRRRAPVCRHHSWWSTVVLLSLLAACGGEPLEQPEPLTEGVPIQYPLELWDRDVEGSTLVRVRVDTTGGVDSVEVAESSGHPAFDSAALEGARELRFRPGRRGAEAVPVWAEIPVHFSKDSMP